MTQGVKEKAFDPPPRMMDRAAFVAKFGGVYEDFPDIAVNTFAHGLTEAEDTVEGLAAAMAAVVDGMAEHAQLQLIRNHPDLAGRLAVGDAMSAASQSEQAGAGLDTCTPEEFARFNRLNETYRQRFGFPFVLAVAGKTKPEILAAFEARINNAPSTELQTALSEIDRIARLRLEALAG